MCCHGNNDDADDNVAAVTTTTTPSMVAIALPAAQNNIQQTKGVNKRKYGDEGVGQQWQIQEERSTMTTMGNQQGLMAPSPTEATGKEEDKQEEE